jgi:hypothetical protein
MKFFIIFLTSLFVGHVYAANSVKVSIARKLNQRIFAKDVNGSFFDKGNGTCGGYGCDSFLCSEVQLQYVGQYDSKKVYLGSLEIESRSGIDFDGPTHKARIEISLARSESGSDTYKIRPSLFGRNANYSTWERNTSSLEDFEPIMIIGYQEQAKYTTTGDDTHSCGSEGCPLFETPFLMVIPCK